MKSFNVGGAVAVFHEDNSWEHPTKEVRDYLDTETEELIRNHSPADGSLREYVFRVLSKDLKATEVIDDDKEPYEDESENTIY